MSNVYTLGGSGNPYIGFDDGRKFYLPAPNGSSRKGIEMYGFTKSILQQFRTEGNKSIEVGKKFLFYASLLFLRASAQDLINFFRAAAADAFSFRPHLDDPLVNYRCKVNGELKFEYFEGLRDSPGGYTIKVDLIGTEYIDTPYMGEVPVVNLGDGFGTHFGEKVGNQ